MGGDQVRRKNGCQYGGGRAMCGQVGWEGAYDLCSFHTVEPYLPITTQAEQLHLPTLAQPWGNFRAELQSGWCWKELKLNAG